MRHSVYLWLGKWRLGSVFGRPPVGHDAGTLRTRLPDTQRLDSLDTSSEVYESYAYRTISTTTQEIAAADPRRETPLSTMARNCFSDEQAQRVLRQWKVTRRHRAAQ